MIKIYSLKQKEIFKSVLRENKFNTNYFTIYFGKKKNELNKNLNISFVMKKKIGNAVKRNKIRRKIKSAVQKIIKNNNVISLNYTYIIFGKARTYKEKFPVIFKEVNNIFKKINNLNY